MRLEDWFWAGVSAVAVVVGIMVAVAIIVAVAYVLLLILFGITTGLQRMFKPGRCRTCGGAPHPGLGCGLRGSEPGPYEDD